MAVYHLLVRMQRGDMLREPLLDYFGELDIRYEMSESHLIVEDISVELRKIRIRNYMLLSYFQPLYCNPSKAVPLNSIVNIDGEYKLYLSLLLELYASSDKTMSRIITEIEPQIERYKRTSLKHTEKALLVAILLLLERELVCKESWLLHEVFRTSDSALISEGVGYYELFLKSKLVKLGLIGTQNVKALDLIRAKGFGERVVEKLVELAEMEN